jgi:hypothetical protein
MIYAPNWRNRCISLSPKFGRSEMVAMKIYRHWRCPIVSAAISLCSQASSPSPAQAPRTHGGAGSPVFSARVRAHSFPLILRRVTHSHQQRRRHLLAGIMDGCTAATTTSSKLLSWPERAQLPPGNFRSSHLVTTRMWPSTSWPERKEMWTFGRAPNSLQLKCSCQLCVGLLANVSVFSLFPSGYKTTQARSELLFPAVEAAEAGRTIQWSSRSGWTRSGDHPCRMWRPRFLISVINANDRISRVKPANTDQT